VLTRERCVVVPNDTSAQMSRWMHPMELLGEWVMWNLVSVRLETLLVSVQYRCRVCAKRTIGLEVIWMHPTILLGDEAQVEACLCSFGDSGSVDARKVHGLRLMYHRLRCCVGRTRWNS
jgi:hypothetical protein